MHSQHPDRIPVITGLGVISSIGNTCEIFFESLLQGRSGIATVKSFDTSAFISHVGCEVTFSEPDELPCERKRQVGRAAQLAVAAANQAKTQAGLSQSDLGQAILCLGTTMGEACWLEAWPAKSVQAGPSALPAYQLLQSGPDQVGADVAEWLGVNGRTIVLAAACAAGNYAIAQAADFIRLGRTAVALAGGTDSFSRTAYAGFSSFGALAAETCRPFSIDRDGLVLAEGAGMLVLEALGHARARGATPLAVVGGYGLSCDAHHIVAPDPVGRGALHAMQAALRDGKRPASEIGYICAHGTGTRANDAAEVAALRALFPSSHAPPISSIKALMGHALGASSAIEAVACVLALHHQILPPTWHFSAPDPACAWDVIPNQPRPTQVSAILNNAYAFGGNNSSVLLCHVDS